MAKQLPKSLEERIVRTPTCWVWLGGHNSEGYSQVQWEGRPLGAHRVIYEALYGPVPEGLEIDHLCRNPGCVNPAHLEAVTHSENIRRGRSSGGGRKEGKVCKHGHDLTDPLNRTSARQGRRCRICHNARVREYKKRAKK